MIDEGYIKFSLTRTEGPAPDCPGLPDLIAMRNQLRSEGLIGVYEDSGIGFGNVSIRTENGFVISGSATGGVPEAGPEHFTLVTAYDFAQNSVSCIGPVDASSESLTHAMFYECSPEIRAVLHIHNEDFWEDLLGIAPTSDENIPYGTPEMAAEVKLLYEAGPLQRTPILVMGGHREGIIAFGKSVTEAGKVLVEWREG